MGVLVGSASEQGKIWGARARDWAECNEPAWSSVFGAVLDLTSVHQGTRYLDIGCGAGGALVQARERGAEPTGIDASEELVAIARSRLPGAEIAIGDMEELPFSTGRFDVVTGINSFQFAADPARALGEAARVCCQGGVVAMLTWGPRQACDLINKIMPAVFALLPPPTSTAAPAPAFSEPGVIEEMMRRAELDPGSCTEFDAVLAFPDLETGVRACLAASARAILHAGEEKVRHAIAAAMSPFAEVGGEVRLGNRFRVVVARKA
jgi:SAM-dependent methyltransferase